MVLHVIGYHMQHIDNASTSVDTNNFTEIFNYVLKNHYLTLWNDKSVFYLTNMILLQCILPDQEREYSYNFNSQIDNSLLTAEKCLTSILDKLT